MSQHMEYQAQVQRMVPRNQILKYGHRREHSKLWHTLVTITAHILQFFHSHYAAVGVCKQIYRNLCHSDLQLWSPLLHKIPIFSKYKTSSSSHFKSTLTRTKLSCYNTKFQDQIRARKRLPRTLNISKCLNSWSTDSAAWLIIKAP